MNGKQLSIFSNQEAQSRQVRKERLMLQCERWLAKYIEMEYGCQFENRYQDLVLLDGDLEEGEEECQVVEVEVVSSCSVRAVHIIPALKHEFEFKLLTYVQAQKLAGKSARSAVVEFLELYDICCLNEYKTARGYKLWQRSEQRKMTKEIQIRRELAR
ncbi:hypothetical protein V6R21_19995 [Limibacter armeniacum]|uniref:hypothetical protein n=1 Tax=Limibacter armeniacum TaxID=466084 RepID=UPI002FE631C4